MSRIYLSSYESPIGTLALYSNGKSLCRLEVEVANVLYDNVNLSVFNETKRWLDVYFSGRRPDFTPEIEFHGTDFQKKVWNELLKIDFGSTSTYGNVAGRIGCRSAQAVGQAVGQNPILIIVPCHRVVASGGKLGGFSAGVERKIWLLENEREFTNCN